MTEKTIFKEPNFEKDRKFLQEEDEKRQRSTLFGKRGNYYKPQEGDENVIRVLQARGEAENAAYHVYVGKHWIQHADRKEMIICMQETYQQPCPVCEEFVKLKQANSALADKYRVKRLGVFNIIDREDEEAGVKLYEATYAVWRDIVQLIAPQKLRFFDGYEKGDDELKLGRDFWIIYNKKASPADMYKVHYTDPCPLGTPEQVKAWYEQITDLVKEVLYPAISYEDAKIKMFGTVQERDALRQKKEKAYAEEPAKDSVEEKITPAVETKEEESKEESEASDDIQDEKPQEKPVEKPKEEKEEKNPEPSKEEPKRDSKTFLDRVEKLRKKHDSEKKK